MYRESRIHVRIPYCAINLCEETQPLWGTDPRWWELCCCLGHASLLCDRISCWNAVLHAFQLCFPTQLPRRMCTVSYDAMIPAASGEGATKHRELRSKPLVLLFEKLDREKRISRVADMSDTSTRWKLALQLRIHRIEPKLT